MTPDAVVALMLLFMLIFGMTASVDSQQVVGHLQRPYGIGAGLGCQFVLLPFLAWCSVRATSPPLPAAVALLCVCCSPGGAYSNWWCSLFNADLGLSVAMTAASSALCVLFLPLNMFIYLSSLTGRADSSMDQVPLPWQSLYVSVGVIMSAVGAGLYASKKQPHNRTLYNKVGNACGGLLILFSILIVTTGVRPSEAPPTPIWSQEPILFVTVTGPCFLGLCLACAVASSPCLHLSRPQRVAVAVECCYQNTAIATAVSLSMFTEKEDIATAIAVPVIYGLVEIVFIGLFLVAAWRLGWTHSPASDSICAVLSGNYQHNAEEQDPPSRRRPALVARSLC